MFYKLSKCVYVCAQAHTCKEREREREREIKVKIKKKPLLPVCYTKISRYFLFIMKLKLPFYTLYKILSQNVKWM